MKAKAKFKVGEQIILQSVSRPHMNGEYTVRSVLYSGDWAQCRISDIPRKFTCVDRETPVYVLEELLNPSDCGTMEDYWCETALRKKHDPSEFTFSGLINSLTNLSMQEEF